jgi:hypothetical protein
MSRTLEEGIRVRDDANTRGTLVSDSYYHQTFVGDQTHDQQCSIFERLYSHTQSGTEFVKVMIIYVMIAILNWTPKT